jgi:dolichol-phosphate mannosyltransferase
VVWQVFALAGRVFSSSAGLLAAGLAAVDPFQIYFCGRLLNETVFITLLLALMYCLLRMQQDWRWLAVAGVCAGLGSLVKPSLWYVAVFCFPFLVLALRNWRRAAVLVAGLLTVQVVIASPWMLRNQRRLGKLTMTTMTGASLYEALGEGATGGPAMEIVKWPPLPSDVTEVQRDALLREAAWRHAREHAGWALQLSVRKFSRFWSPILNFTGFRKWPYHIMSAGWYVPVMALFFVGAWRQRRSWHRWLWLLAPVFYFTALHSIFVGSVRYRIPVMPLICGVAGAAFIRSFPRRQQKVGLPAGKLSIIVPFLNEARTLRQVVEQLFRLPMPTEIILVDDGSHDGSGAVADALVQEQRGAPLHTLKVFHHARNQGKGMAIRTALPAVTGEVVVVQDADLEYNPQDLVKLWELIARGETEVVYGSRTLGSREHSYRSFYWGGQVVGWVCNLLFTSRLTDEPTCYKMMRAELLQDMTLQSQRFEFCPEVTAKLLRQGAVIRELPIAYHPRTFTEGKKIRWTDGLRAIWTLVRYRFAD